MLTPARQEKLKIIERSAYQLLSERGYEGTSMLSIAKASKSSNETLYRWFGDKQGLFRVLVERNAADVKSKLEEAIKRKSDPIECLREVSPVLLSMVLGERAISLNRAAASDQSRELGQAIADAGRNVVAPLIAEVIADFVERNRLPKGDVKTISELYLSLLIGDLQIRRVIGVLPLPTGSEIEVRTSQAIEGLVKICEPAAD